MRTMTQPMTQPVVFESELIEGVRDIFERKSVFNTLLSTGAGANIVS